MLTSNNRLFESFKASLGGGLSDLKDHLTSIQWVEQTVFFAKYTASLANKEAWLASCDAYNALSGVLSAMSRAEEAMVDCYNAEKSANALKEEASNAERDACFAEMHARRAEQLEIQAEQEEILRKTKRPGYSEDSLDFIQSGGYAVLNQQIRQTFKETNKNDNSKSNVESFKAEKNTYRDNRKNFVDLKENATILKEFSEIEMKGATQSKLVAKIEQEAVEKVRQEAINRSNESKNIANNSKLEIYNANSLKDNFDNKTTYGNDLNNFLLNLAMVLNESQESKKEITNDSIDKLEDLEVLATKSSVNIYDQIQEQFEGINNKITADKEAIKLYLVRNLKNAEVPIILSKEFSDYQNQLNELLNNKIKIDQRHADRRSIMDRRDSIRESNPKQIEEQREKVTRRQADRRENDYKKALFIDSKEIINLLS